MNPILLGSLTALCWGTVDFIAARTSPEAGAIRTTAGVTIAGLIVLTIWLAIGGAFPSFTQGPIWLPLLAGAGFALATMCLFAAIGSGPISLAVPIVMAYPATGTALAAALGDIPSAMQVALSAVVMGGVLIVAISEPASDGAPTGLARRRRTIIFALLSHVIFLVTVLAGQRAALAYGEIESVWISRLAGTAAILPFLFVREGEGRMSFRIVTLFTVMGGLDVAALCFLFAAASTPHPQLAVVCASAAGVVTVILAAVFLREPIVLARWTGIAITFAGIAALTAIT
jgi:drug/metabolite transporter (DMT)-like permease